MNLDRLTRYRPSMTVIVATSIVVVTLLIAAHLFEVVSMIVRDAGRTDDATPTQITVAGVPMSIPRNMTRIAGQRAGQFDQVDLFFHWPSLNGYDEGNAAAFRRIDSAAPIIYLTISGRDVGLSPSERLSRVYARLFTGKPLPGPAGLTARRVQSGHGYDGDLIYYQADNDTPYVARCSEDSAKPIPTCLRDVAPDARIAVTYRFGKGLLPHWRDIDAAVIALVQAFIATAR